MYEWENMQIINTLIGHNTKQVTGLSYLTFKNIHLLIPFTSLGVFFTLLYL